MSLMLEHEMYRENIELLVDECVSMFNASTSTVTSITCSMIHFSIIYPEWREKVLKEID